MSAEITSFFVSKSYYYPAGVAFDEALEKYLWKRFPGYNSLEEFLQEMGCTNEISRDSCSGRRVLEHETLSVKTWCTIVSDTEFEILQEAQRGGEVVASRTNHIQKLDQGGAPSPLTGDFMVGLMKKE